MVKKKKGPAKIKIFMKIEKTSFLFTYFFLNREYKLLKAVLN